MPRARKTAGAARVAKRASANGVTEAEIVAAVKKEKLGQSAVAKSLGVPLSAVPIAAYCRALVSAGWYETAPGTEASIKKLYAGGDRFELVAARTGTTVAHVREVIPPEMRRNGAGPRAKSGSSAKTSGASGKRASVKKTGAASKVSGGQRRSRTRAERVRARSGNPS
jgi:hypothetical protein